MKESQPNRISQRNIYRGGEPEIDNSEYVKRDTRAGCEQLAHLLRSLYWQPNHAKHFNKIKHNENRP